jgi:hypothetical protein
MNVSAQENDFTPAEQVSAGVQYSVVEFEQFADYEFEAPATFFTRSAMGQYYYYHTRARAKAQEACDELFGKGRYTVNSSEISKSRKTPTCTGTHTRRGQQR